MGRVITSMVMPGGWHFLQDGVGQPVTAPTYEDLPKALLKFRIENGLPIGDVEREVEQQICSRHPHCCRNGEVLAASVAVTKSKVTDFLDIVMGWLRGRQSSETQLQVVTRDVAERRAKVCLECPKHKRYTGCPDCVVDIERRSAQLRSNQDTPLTHRLAGCRAHGIDARSAVFFDLTAVNPPMNNDVPHECWMNQV